MAMQVGEMTSAPIKTQVAHSLCTADCCHLIDQALGHQEYTARVVVLKKSICGCAVWLPSHSLRRKKMMLSWHGGNRVANAAMQSPVCMVADTQQWESFMSLAT